MKKFKIAVMIVISCLVLLCIPGVSYAQDDMTSIKGIADSGLKRFKEDVNSNKDQFGLKSSDSVENIYLGDGIKYYSIAASILNQNDLTSYDSDNILDFNGYIFPMKFNNKSIGTAYVQYSNNKWSFLKTSWDTLDDNIFKVNDSFKMSSNKLVIDETINVSGLLNEDSNNSFFVPMDNNSILNLTAYQKIETKNLIDSIKSSFKPVEISYSEIPSGTVIIDNIYYDLDYANTDMDEISKAISCSNGKIYIKEADGTLIDNNTNQPVSENMNTSNIKYTNGLSHKFSDFYNVDLNDIKKIQIPYECYNFFTEDKDKIKYFLDSMNKMHLTKQKNQEETKAKVSEYIPQGVEIDIYDKKNNAFTFYFMAEDNVEINNQYYKTNMDFMVLNFAESLNRK